MNQYLNLLSDILENGEQTGDRTGTGTLSVFGRQMRFDLQKGFPIVTTKRVFWRGVVEELLWMLRGETNVKSLQEKNVHIWDEWADENGELGPVYGSMWRKWPTNQESDNRWLEEWKTIDQISNIINRIKTKPTCRRLILNAWNVGKIDEMRLPPCHLMAQFRVYDDKLKCQVYIRSNDFFLGAPFNIAQYALLTHIIANVTGLVADELVYTIGDAHLYLNHLEQAKKQLQREPLPLPELKIKRKFEHIDDNLKYEDFELVNYKHHKSIKAPVSV